MYYVVYDKITAHVFRTCDARVGAVRSCNAQNKKLRRDGHYERYGWTTSEDYDKNINTMTITYNMLDPTHKPIEIRKADLGGCCDPATERYHSM